MSQTLRLFMQLFRIKYTDDESWKNGVYVSWMLEHTLLTSLLTNCIQKLLMLLANR